MWTKGSSSCLFTWRVRRRPHSHTHAEHKKAERFDWFSSWKLCRRRARTPGEWMSWFIWTCKRSFDERAKALINWAYVTPERRRIRLNLISKPDEANGFATFQLVTQRRRRKCTSFPGKLMKGGVCMKVNAQSTHSNIRREWKKEKKRRRKKGNETNGECIIKDCKVTMSLKRKEDKSLILPFFLRLEKA